MILEYLKDSRLFGSFPAETLHKLIPLSKMSQFRQGEKILEEGQINDRIYFLIRGSVAIYAGGQLILTLQRIGDIFGEMSIIDSKPCSASVIASDPVNDVFSISSSHVGKYTDLHPEELQNIMYRLFSKILTEKLNLTTSKAKQYEETNLLLEDTQKALHDDIERREQVEEELRLANENSEAANRAKTQFLANMSHEIRTPLNSIVGFSQILQRRIQAIEAPDEFRQYLQSIEMAGHTLSELINNILDLSKIESGKLEMMNENMGLPKVLQDVFEMNKSLAIQKHLDYRYEIDPNLPDTIVTDRTKFIQILTNLLGNAIKFTPERHGVFLKAERESDSLSIHVIDHGIGVNPEDRENIFEAFEQVDGKITRKFGGSGLGLTITKKIVELMKGEIDVETTPGGGATFYVHMPFIEGESSASNPALNQIEHVKFSPDSRILIVEDNPMNQMMIRALFEDLGLKIEMADNGKLGVEKAHKIMPDLILMDMHMPVMSGLEATDLLRSSHEFDDTPILALSADAFTEQQIEALSKGVQEYLIKPVEIDSLFPLLKKYLQWEFKPIP